MSVVLSLKNLSKSFGPKTILQPLNLEIQTGSFVALLGPSGCGKTTLLRMIAGLEKPTQGEIWIKGRNATELPPEERDLGMVFQSYAVWPHMTVSQNVEFPLGLARRKHLDPQAKKEALTQALKMVHLEELSHRYPHELSGGQQQRVALARGIAMKPSILLLDEPLSNLDARLRAEMRKEMKELHRSLGLTWIYVTHDQREAFEMSTQVIVLNEGKIAQMGTPEQVKGQPAPGFVQEFLALG